ncbi:hypothetical protein [Micromonospora sp. NPDC007230]|uniref:hypothetical protein n=1 Tax=Micromonospora sp. NPDC007230 TaxID=3364237 RepID=UPI00367EA8F8
MADGVELVIRVSGDAMPLTPGLSPVAVRPVVAPVGDGVTFGRQPALRARNDRMRFS